ncbi:MAG TPA: FtsX-like permease family protein, partial [Thermoanaerobaculia bacterium]|nr:FtsX-like permease family protein [Thermoanaerobaculia bacterium]
MEFGPILRTMRLNKVRYGLIAAEIALTLAIVVNCINLIRDARREMAIESGFDDHNLISVRSTPFDKAFEEDGYYDNALRQDLDAIRSVPGVVAVSNTRFLPWQGGGSSTETRVAGSKGEMLRNQVYNADESTLAALGARLIEGRNFTRDEVDAEVIRLRNLFNTERPRDSRGQPLEKISQDIIISKAFAKLLFPDGKALGKRLEDTDGDQYQVVGIIDRFYNPYGWPIHEYVMFFPNTSRSFQFGAPFLVRAKPGEKEAVAAAIEKKLLALNNGRNVRTRTVSDIKKQFQGQSTLLVTVLSVLIVLLVFVTSLGIVGLTVFSVTERTRQIGTRRALGAQRADILRYFLLENWIVTTIGLAVGALLAYGLNVFLVSKVNGAKMDPLLVLGGILLLWIAGLAATFVPARRGASVAP